MTAAAFLALACLLWPSAERAGGSPRPVATDGSIDGASDGAAAGAAAPGPGPAARLDRWSARLRGRLRGGGPRGRSAWVADFAEVVAVGLDAGLDLGSAVVVSARSPEVLDRAPWLLARVRASAAAGLGVSGCLEPPDAVAAQDRRDLALLAAAWRLAEDLGARASDVTAAAAGAVRSRGAAHERAVVLAAGPRASMWLLTALPLAGPVAGALVGVGPDQLYASGAARVAALAGLLLTGGGWWWSRTLLARARRPGRTSGEPR